jgi:hypothetical protein
MSVYLEVLPLANLLLLDAVALNNDRYIFTLD